jgi:gluconate 2-dehydrogenase gamma chain
VGSGARGGAGGRSPDGPDPAVEATIRAAVERIIPSDDGLPGAREAGTYDFVADEAISRGAAGLQALAARAALLDQAAAAADPERPGARFVDLSPDQQDAVLLALETEGSAALGWLVELTMEGFYGDPRHGGNRAGVSWEMIGFPGPTGGTGYEPPFGWYDANEPNLPGLGPDGSSDSSR